MTEDIGFQRQRIGKTPYRQRRHLDYPEKTMYTLIEEAALQYPEDTALEFYGRKTSWARFLFDVKRISDSFIKNGVVQGSTVTICMPNVPQAVVSFYALNRIGATANMIHPLSSQNEITTYLEMSDSIIIVTLDIFYEKVREAVKNTGRDILIIVARIIDELPIRLMPFYFLNTERKYLKYPRVYEKESKIPTDDPEGKIRSLLWTTFAVSGRADGNVPVAAYDPGRASLILYSSGSSGEPHGIVLSDKNVNALAFECVEALGISFERGTRMLSCMPLFHGFGIGIGIHTVMVQGVTCILLPTFTRKSYAGALKKKKPHIIAGVPTIFDALLRIPELKGVDLSFLRGMYCGGDTLSVELKQRVDAFLREHGASIQVCEGYGLTECVAASCVTPRDEYKEGSIGIPFPDMEYKIVKPGTEKELPHGKEGEIIISGPTVMLRYLKNPEDTKKALRVLSDGKTWLYTGDAGIIDDDGYVYFRQRLKRIIITNGYNVYPAQLEREIEKCPDVDECCVIGVKDPRRVQRVRAYVTLQKGVVGDDECRQRIMNEIRLSISLYALPKEIIFRDALPRTLLGKVAYRKLEEEAEAETKK